MSEITSYGICGPADDRHVVEVSRVSRNPDVFVETIVHYGTNEECRARIELLLEDEDK